MGKFFKEALEGISIIDRTSISDAVNDAYKTIDTLAMYARQKSDSVIWNLMKVSPSEMCDFNTRNGVFMLRLMRLNDQEKKITLNALGVDAMYNGDSTAISEAAISPSYAKEMNYKDLFAKNLSSYEKNGQETTRKAIDDGPYKEIVNLYPDDNNTGTFLNKWVTLNQNSLLNKTKKMFNQNKINTIISRFHTDPTTPEKAYDIKTKFGLSHGRNLLTAKAEKNGGTYTENGYDNPYCRVWTHHYQYDRIKKMMRPFRDKEGNVVLLKTFNEWNGFDETGLGFKSGYEEGDDTATTIGYKKWGWKSKQNDQWKNSVLNPTGMLNITPKYLGGGNSNIHTKQCMFSIENLAWRDYDPYSFEQALSWEQRGPMGGRIMWFPPYGINFTETTSTQWNGSSFIGRGEDVYTYVNTTRTGTLNFMLVVDHPSILDYASWYEGSKGEVKDTDVYRFFAGCDSADPNDPDSLLSKVKPTPLTDEYIEGEEINEAEEDAEKKPKPKETTPTEPIELVFYVFFPNNYAGYYDRTGSKVEAIPYLLYGKGAQMKEIGSGKITESVDLNFENPDLIDKECTGYEMEQPIGENKDNYVAGCSYIWSNLKSEEPYAVAKGTSKRWYYRIDGEYKTEYIKDGNKSPNFYINCYDQVQNLQARADRKCSFLNKDASAVYEQFTEENKELLFSLADIATVLCKEEAIKEKIKADSKKVQQLEEYLSGIKDKKYTIEEITIQGFSNSHDDNIPLKEGRNKALAKNRAETVKDWLVKYRPDGIEEENWKINTLEPISSHPIDGGNQTDHSEVAAKKWRSARVVIKLNTVQEELQSETDQKPTTFEFNDEVFKGWVDCIEKNIRKLLYLPTSEDKKKEVKENFENDIITIINSCLPNNKDTFYQDIILKYKENFEDLFIYDENVTFGDNVEILFDNETAIQILFRNLGYYLTEDIASLFENMDDFENSLGQQLKEQIRGLKKYKDYISKISKTNNDNIETQIKAIQEEIDKLEKEKGEYEQKRNDEKSKIKANQFESTDRDGKIQDNKIEIAKCDNLIKDETTTDEDRQKYKKKIEELEAENKILEQEKSKFDELVKQHTENYNQYDKYIKDIEDTIKKNEDKKSELEERKSSTEIAKPVLEGSDIKGVVKKYIKDKGNIEEKELDNIVDKFVSDVIETTDIDKDITFNKDIWQSYNYCIDKYVKQEDKSTKVKRNELYKSILELPVKFVDKILGDDFTYDDVSFDKLDETAFNELVSYLEDNPIYVNTDESNYNKFKDLVYNCINETSKNVFVCLNAEYNEGIYEDIKAKIQKDVDEKNKALDNSQFKGFSEHVAEDGSIYYINENEYRPELMGRHWIYDEANNQFVLKKRLEAKERVIRDEKTGKVIGGETNQWRYDQEYHFFKKLEKENPLVFQNLMDKIQYFDPAFHSMTPEGFNARLTFLNQCMRQGDTRTAADVNASSANNLAFGRPPYCVLRLGDFYNQMIIIDNVSISYDTGGGLQWDLNQEGIGVQPLLANVSISFKFIGGGDLGGPVRRLQNAMSFNYYANTSLYDNRADRMVYGWSEKTNGALEGDRKLDLNNSTFYKSALYGKK